MDTTSCTAVLGTWLKCKAWSLRIHTSTEVGTADCFQNKEIKQHTW